MKKRISILLVVAMLINIVCSFSVVSADGPTVLIYGGSDFVPATYGITEYTAGKEANAGVTLADAIVLNVAIKDMSNLAGFGVSLKFDPEVVYPMFCLDPSTGDYMEATDEYMEMMGLTGIKQPAISTGAKTLGTLGDSSDGLNNSMNIIFSNVMSTNKYRANPLTNKVPYLPLLSYVFGIREGKEVTATTFTIPTRDEAIAAGASKDMPDSVYYTDEANAAAGIHNTPAASTLSVILDYCKAAAEPTPAPTAEPTPAPTAEPTPAPTAEPTPAPTAEPTPAPTAEPTPAPTAEPTPAPTAEPTPAPTAEPTAEPSSETRLDPNDLFFLSGIENVVASDIEGVDFEADALDGFEKHVIGGRLLDQNADIKVAVVDEFTTGDAITEWKDNWATGIDRLAANATKYIVFKVTATDGVSIDYHVVKLTNPGKTEAGLKEMWVCGFDVDSLTNSVVENLDAIDDTVGEALKLKSFTWSPLVVQAVRNDLNGATVNYKIGATYADAKAMTPASYYALVLKANTDFVINDRLFVEITAEDGVTTNYYVFNFVK